MVKCMQNVSAKIFHFVDVFLVLLLGPETGTNGPEKGPETLKMAKNEPTTGRECQELIKTTPKTWETTPKVVEKLPA